MSFESYLTPEEAAEIKAELTNAFATRMELGTTFDLVLERDDTHSGEPVNLPAQRVLFSLAKREPTYVQRNAASYYGADGQLEKAAPFDVRKGDRFRLPATAPDDRGSAGVITIVLPARNGVVTALFTLQV